MQPIRIKHALRGPWSEGATTHAATHDAPPPPGLFHGDFRDPVTGVVRRGDPGPIVGIVDFVAQTRYGFSSRGVPQYLFHPADTRFPPMIVGSKAAPVANQWGLVTTKGSVWNTAKSRWPSVTLQRLIGPVGDQDVEAEALRLQYMRPVAPLAAFAMPDPPTGPVSEWDEILNIDPVGCRDVDDILAWRRVGDRVQFGIGIANVSALVPRGSALDVAACQRTQTLYRDGQAVEPMLPATLSEGAGSLLADGTPRGVVLVSWYIEEGVVTGPVWSTTRLVNRRAFTYESILDDPVLSNKIPALLASVTGLTVAEVGGDSHRWVELAMIAYNRAAAEQVSFTGILRRHRGVTAAEYGDLAVKTGCKELAFLGYAAGEYVQADWMTDVAHAGLGLARYCHASSPLRRYADLVNQRILVGMLEAEDVQGMVEVGLADWLNERAKEARAYERATWCLSQLSAKELRSATGWVLRWTKTTNIVPEVRVHVYVPAWRRTVKVPMSLLKVEESQIHVGSRGGNQGWWIAPGTSVCVTAFWDVRGTPEHRFVFRATPTETPTDSPNAASECH